MNRNTTARVNSITLLAFAAIVSILIFLSGCSSQLKEQKLPVRVLILPKFEQGEIAGDFPGEAQCFYEEYLSDGDVYEIEGSSEIHKLYYKNGVATAIPLFRGERRGSSGCVQRE